MEIKPKVFIKNGNDKGAINPVTALTIYKIEIVASLRQDFLVLIFNIISVNGGFEPINRVKKLIDKNTPIFF